VLSGPISPKQEVFHPGKKVFSPKRGYGRPGENGPGTALLSRPISLKREDFRSSEKDSRSS